MTDSGREPSRAGGDGVAFLLGTERDYALRRASRMAGREGDNRRVPA
jgi:hypothetical protein